MSDELKWSRDRHDSELASKLERDEAAKDQATIGKIARLYQEQKRTLRQKKKATAEDIKAWGKNLETIIDKNCTSKGLQNFRRTTLEILRDDLEVLRLTEFNVRNCYTPLQDCKLSPDLTEAQQPVKRRYTFTTQPEFEALADTRRFVMADGFAGWLLDGGIVNALFEDGAMVMIGMVANGIGLERLPSVAQYRANLELHRKRNGEPPAKGGKKGKP